MLLRGDRKGSRRVVWKDNAVGIRRGWYNDAHRKRINGRSRRWRRVWVSRRKFQQEDQEEPGNVSKTVTLFLFDFEFLTYKYISWPDMYRGHLTKTNDAICVQECPNFNIWGYGLQSKRFEGSWLYSKIILGLQATKRWSLGLHGKNFRASGLRPRPH